MVGSDFDFARLRRIGFGPPIFQSLALFEVPPGAHPMRFTEVQRDMLMLQDGDPSIPARTLPAVRMALTAPLQTPVVGDWVLAQRTSLGEWWVIARMPPMTELSRRTNDGCGGVQRQTLVSNVDTALLVMGLDGDLNRRGSTATSRWCAWPASVRWWC